MHLEPTKYCKRCDRVLPVSEFFHYYRTERDGTRRPSVYYLCTPCKVSRTREWRHENPSAPRSYTIRQCLAEILRKAKARRTCSLTVEDLVDLWHAQEGICALTGWPMTTIRHSGPVVTNVSLDRIDSTQDYHLGNVQLVCRAANQAKSDSSSRDFIFLCRAIAAQQDITQ